MNTAVKQTESKARDKIYVGAYVSIETHGKLIEAGKSRELSLSDVVREAVREYLAKCEKAEA